jgi:hypothetical protein
VYRSAEDPRAWESLRKRDRHVPITNPIILIGMHRSGTTLLCRMLESLGYFAGWRQDPNGESHFFRDLNDWLLGQCGASWEYPLPLENLLEDEEARALAGDYLRRMLASPRSASYLGPLRYLRLRDVARLDGVWGWKDPRNTFTLPIWLDLFPRARVLHVRRHGVDVAHSLAERSRRSRGPHRRAYQRGRSLYWIHPKRGGFASSLRAVSLERGLEMWEEYITRADEHVSRLGAQARAIGYEALLARPAETLEEVARFCGLDAGEGAVARAVRSVRRERAFAHRQSPALRELALRNAHRLTPYGYAEAAGDPAEKP